jgi:hypothetical protein
MHQFPRWQIGLSAELVHTKIISSRCFDISWARSFNRLAAKDATTTIPIVFGVSDDPVPTENPKPLTATANRLILAPDERSLQVDLVRLGRTV